MSRIVGQISLGVAVGLAFAIPLSHARTAAAGDGFGSARGTAFLPGIPAFLLAAGLLAALGPARRGLRIQPTEALRE